MLEYLFPERAVLRVIPDLQNARFIQVAENIPVHILPAPGEVALEGMPEEVAGVNIAVPGNKNAAVIYKIACPFVFGRRAWQAQVKPRLFGHSLGLFEGFGQVLRHGYIPFRQVIPVQENVALPRLGDHLQDEIDHALLFRGPNELAMIDMEEIGDIYPLFLSFFLP